MAKAYFYKSGLTASLVRIGVGVVEAIIVGIGTNILYLLIFRCGRLKYTPKI